MQDASLQIFGMRIFACEFIKLTLHVSLELTVSAQDRQKKGISVIARTCFYTITDLHDGWIDGAIKNLSDIKNIKVDSQLFKKQNGLTHRQSIFYNYLCFLLYYNLKRGNYFKFLSELQDKSYLGFNDPFVEIDNIYITSDKIISLLDCEKIDKAFNFDGGHIHVENHPSLQMSDALTISAWVKNPGGAPTVLGKWRQNGNVGLMYYM